MCDMGPNNEPPPGDVPEGQISKAVLGCLDSFRRLMSMGDALATQTLLPTIRDEETRFKVWSGNIGAHKQGRSSLDYRLRDASHLQTQVLGLLAELTGLFEDFIAIVQGDKVPWDMLDEDPLREGEEEETGIPETELGQIATDVIEVVNCLLRLSVSIRNPAPHDRLKSSAGHMTRYYETFDIQHVRSKFDSVNNTIADRLGKAISKRREYFRYRETHHAKLSHGLQSDHHHQEVGSTVASSIPRQMKGPGVAAGTDRMPIVDEDASSVANMSESSFASSVGSNDKLRIPPLPSAAHRGPFECPFCFMMIAATNTRSWKRHVYADLRPYICLSEDCQTPEYEFDRRRDWIQHELQYHWKTYTCPFGCPGNPKHPSAAALRGHLNTEHKNNVSASQLDALIDLSARPLKIEDGIDCGLCGERLFSIRTYRRHVGRHQEQISLFALPSLAHADEDESTDGENSTDGCDEVDGSLTEPRGFGTKQPESPKPYNPFETPSSSLTPHATHDEGYDAPRVTGHVKTGGDNEYRPHLDPGNDVIPEVTSKVGIGRALSPDKQLGSRTPQYPPQEEYQQRSERPGGFTEQVSDRLRRVAHVEEVDEFGNVIEGTARLAEMEYDPPSIASPSKVREIPNTGRTRRERTRRGSTASLIDSDSTLDPRRHLPKSSTPTISRRASYYGAYSPTVTPSSSPPREYTSRPQKVYKNSRPPAANTQWYQTQAPQPLQQLPIGSYPLSSWGGGTPYPILPPSPLPIVSQSPINYFTSRPLEARFGTSVPRPQSSIGFRPPTRSVPFDDSLGHEDPTLHRTQPRPPPPYSDRRRPMNPPPRRVFDEDDFVADSDLFHDISPHQSRYDEPLPPSTNPVPLPIRPPSDTVARSPFAEDDIPEDGRHATIDIFDGFGNSGISPPPVFPTKNTIPINEVYDDATAQLQDERQQGEKKTDGSNEPSHGQSNKYPG